MKRRKSSFIKYVHSHGVGVVVVSVVSDDEDTVARHDVDTAAVRVEPFFTKTLKPVSNFFCLLFQHVARIPLIVSEPQ